MNPVFNPNAMRPMSIPQMGQQQQMQQQANLQQNNIKHHVAQLFQSQQLNFRNNDPLGWQAQMPIQERISAVMQISSQIQLARQLPASDAAKEAVKLETNKFLNSPDKPTYLAFVRSLLEELHRSRQNNTQSMQHMMPMSNPMNPGNPGAAPQAPMQANPAMHNAFLQQQQQQQQQQPFPAQLQHQMQPSSIAQNQQMAMNPQFAQQMAAQQSNMGAQPMGNMGIPGMDAAKFEAAAQQFARTRFTPEQIQQLNNQLMQQSVPVRTAIINQGGPAIVKAREMLRNQLQQRAQNQNNPMMQDQMNMQRTASQMLAAPGQMGNGFDISQISNQQADAMRLQESGGLVVPASNNAGMTPAQRMAAMSNNMPQNAMALQNMQNRQAAPNAMRQAPFINPQQAAQQAQQVQANIHAQQQKQAAQRAAIQNANANNSGNPQAQMSLLTQPMQGQQPGNTTPQSRPVSTMPQIPQGAAELEQHQHQMQMALQSVSRLAQTPQWIAANPPIRAVPAFMQGLPENIKAVIMRLPESNFQALSELFTKQALLKAQQSKQANAMQPTQTPQMPAMTPTANMQRPPQQGAMPTPGQTPNMQQPGQLGAVAPGQRQMITPEMLVKLDAMPINTQLLSANRITAPNGVKTWLQLKEIMRTNPGVFPPGFNNQTMLQMQIRQSQMMNASMRSSNQTPNQQSMTQVQTAPPAVMMNGAGQAPQQQQQLQQTQQIPPEVYSVSPQDIAMFRQRLNASGQNMNGSDTSDNALLQIIRRRKIQQWQANSMAANANGLPPQTTPQQQQQQQHQMRLAQQQHSQSQAQAGIHRPASAVQQQRPQMPAQMAQTVSQPQRASQPPATPQQGVKRPHPDGAIDITQSTPQNRAAQASVAAQTQAQNQQAPIAGVTQQQPPSISPFAAKFTPILRKVAETPLPANFTLTPNEKQMIMANMNNLKQPLQGLDTIIKTAGDKLDPSNQLVNLKMLEQLCMARQIVMTSADIKTLTIKDKTTAGFDKFTGALGFIQKWVTMAIGAAKQTRAQPDAQQQAAAAAASAGPSQPSQADSANMRAPTPLNAANLEAHQKQAQAAHQKLKGSNNQPPPAPTSGPGQAPAGGFAQSPQGTPQYGSQNVLTADKLRFPPSKKQKNAKGVATPAGPTSAPAADTPSSSSAKISPEMTKSQLTSQPVTVVKPATPAPPALNFRCSEPDCDKAYATAAQLTVHSENNHIKDHFKFCLGVLEKALGFNEDGSRIAGFGVPKDEKKAAVPTKATAPTLQAPFTAIRSIKSAASPASTAPAMSRGPSLNPAAKSTIKPGSIGASTPAADNKAPTIKAASPSTPVDTDPWLDCLFTSTDCHNLFAQYDTLDVYEDLGPQNSSQEMLARGRDWFDVQEGRDTSLDFLPGGTPLLSKQAQAARSNKANTAATAVPGTTTTDANKENVIPSGTSSGTPSPATSKATNDSSETKQTSIGIGGAATPAIASSKTTTTTKPLETDSDNLDNLHNECGFSPQMQNMLDQYGFGSGLWGEDPFHVDGGEDGVWGPGWGMTT